MFNAILWGTIAASATLLGALLTMYLSIPKRLIGFIMALGTGALIGATSYELLEDALMISGFTEIAIGFLGGALIFTILDIVVSHRGGQRRKETKPFRESKAIGTGQSNSGLGMFIGTVMDTLPESAMIGMSIASGDKVSAALVVSIFISNLPEGLSSTVSLQKSGYSKKKILGLWLVVVFFSAVSSGAGLLLLYASNSIKAITSAFAGGAIIAMISSTMMPEAYKEGGPIVGFVTTLGMFLALFLHHLG
ncbi:ZIP family zinc transporter [Paraliobacillus quinghaiensis]|uniref:ZIP family zinc transporter n=1 Tax=Paraliobacillus quinghaiensis TaxID=470815 RepID=A0A917WXC1_9BACI|nr:ZIP family metal transporter [Paraliobacillus quinghaiensis]GGM41821.1 ZIP family zinc transporter [Paraliobacillus quinghaiensis]